MHLEEMPLGALGARQLMEPVAGDNDPASTPPPTPPTHPSTHHHHTSNPTNIATGLGGRPCAVQGHLHAAAAGGQQRLRPARHRPVAGGWVLARGRLGRVDWGLGGWGSGWGEVRVQAG